MENSQEFLKREFIHLVSETLDLLGAETGLIEEIRSVEQNPFSSKVIDRIRKYNREKMKMLNARIALLNTTFSFPEN